MDELIAFVAARLDQEEAIARAAASVAGPDWTWDPDSRDGYLRTPDGTIMADALHVEDDQFRPHVARHDPARVLRDVAAGRRLLANYEEIALPDPDASPQERALRMVVAEVVRMLILDRAAVWCDHPDYRQEWAPENL